MAPARMSGMFGNRDYLTSLGRHLGIDAAEVAELFTTDKYAADVRHDFEEGRALTGVPFFVIDRKFGLSGAQPAETFTAALEHRRGRTAGRS